MIGTFGGKSKNPYSNKIKIKLSGILVSLNKLDL